MSTDTPRAEGADDYDACDDHERSYPAGGACPDCDAKDLARKLADSGRVPWVRGMIYIAKSLRYGNEQTGCITVEDVARAQDGLSAPTVRPVNSQWVARIDLDDDGNRGHLLARARDLWGEPRACTEHGFDIHGEEWWDFGTRNSPSRGHGKTEIEAICAAILAAPEPS